MAKRSDEDRPRCCAFCENAVPLRDGETMLCRNRGVVSGGNACRKFVYDPLKRKPRPLPAPPGLMPEADLQPDFGPQSETEKGS